MSIKNEITIVSIILSWLDENTKVSAYVKLNYHSIVKVNFKVCKVHLLTIFYDYKFICTKKRL